jgi:hypothetical protein
MMALLVFWADRWDVHSFLRSYPSLEVDRWWRAGEPRKTGGACRDSGFQVELATNEDWGQLISAALKELEALREVVAGARSQSARVALDLALFVGAEDHFTRSIAFSPAHLRALVDAGVEIGLTAYPTSAEDDKEGR